MTLNGESHIKKMRQFSSFPRKNLKYLEIFFAIFEKIPLVWYHGTKNTGRRETECV